MKYSVGNVADLVTGKNKQNTPNKLNGTPKNKQNAVNTPNKSNGSPKKANRRSRKRKSSVTNSGNESTDNAVPAVQSPSPAKKTKVVKNTPGKAVEIKKEPVEVKVEPVEVKSEPKEASKEPAEASKAATKRKRRKGQKKGSETQKSDQNQKSDENQKLTTARKGRKGGRKVDGDEVKEDPELAARTIYVGNVPIDVKKTKLEIFFAKFGEVESARFRGVAVSDPKLSKKIAVIRNKLHADRKSQIAYVRFATVEAAQKALNANGALFHNHHLRVTLSTETPKGDADKAIFVGNLSFGAEEEDIWQIFEKCGPIDFVRVLRDKNTGMAKGFCYVNFKSSDAVQIALEMEPVTYKERELRVQPCRRNLAEKSSKKNNEPTQPRKPKNEGKKKQQKQTFSNEEDVEAPKLNGNSNMKKVQKKINKPQEMVDSDGSEDAGEQIEDDGSGDEEENIVEVQRTPKQPKSNFQGAMTTGNKKKKKFNKGAIQKKQLARKLVPKGKSRKTM